MAEGKGHTELQPAYCFPIRASRKHLFVSDAQMRVIAEMADRPDREFWAKHIVTAVNTYPAVEGLVKALEDWLYYAEENLSEFDYEDCHAEKLCHQCESSGCINLKIRNARSALSRFRFRSLQNGGANG